jgi:hypothetical protein
MPRDDIDNNNVAAADISDNDGDDSDDGGDLAVDVDDNNSVEQAEAAIEAEIERRREEETKMSKYHLATDADFDEFKRKCEEEGNGWEIAYEGNGSKVCRKRGTGDAIDPVRVSTTFPTLDPEILYDILHDHAYRAVWDTNMIDGIVIEQLDERNEIGYYSAKAPLGISNRDFLNQRMWRHKDDEWIIMNHAIEHPEWPAKKGFVRATSVCSGYYIAKKPAGCYFVYYTQSNPNGWIPGFVINNIMSTFAPKMVEKLYQAALDYPAWKAKNNPDQKPWRK